MYKNKAQVTIFIIIAVVILAIIALFFILRQTTQVSDIPSVTIDKQVQPVYQFMEDCFEEKTLKGLELLRLQAGYIYLPHDVDTIQAETDSGTKEIPIWVSEKTIAVPSLDFMETQLEQYLSSEIADCSSRLEDFRKRGFNIEQGIPEINVKLDDKVEINVKYPTYIDYKEKSYSFEEFSTKINVNMKEVFDVLVDLVIYELSYNYLEYHANNLISLYSYSGGEKKASTLPPFTFTDTNLDCNFIAWSYPEVESNLKNIFQQNYPQLKMAKTNFEKVKTNDAISQGVYDSFVHEYFPEMSNIKIDFIYKPDYGMNLRMRPASLIPERTSRSGIPFLPAICTFDYKFDYTFSAPILVKVTDTNSANIKQGKLAEKGFTFYFPMKVYVCENNPRACGENPDYILDVAKLEEATGVKLYNCKDTADTLSVYVKDEDSTALENVDITHYCNGYANDCWLGRTDSSGMATLNIPECENSTLELIKQGYGTLKDELKNAYTLYKIRQLDVDIKLIKADKFLAAYDMTAGFTKSACGKSPATLLGEVTYLPTDKDEIIINFGNFNTIPVAYPASKKVELAIGSYELTTIVNSEVTIKPSSYEGTVISFNQDDKNKPYKGKWMMGATTYTAELQSGDMANNPKITFYAFVEHLSTEDLEVKSFDNTVIQTDSLSGQVQVDEDCNGITETKLVSITQDKYNTFIKPKFSQF